MDYDICTWDCEGGSIPAETIDSFDRVEADGQVEEDKGAE